MSGSESTANEQQKATNAQMRINFAEQRAILNRFTSSSDFMTSIKKNIFFTNTKHIMDPEVIKAEPGKVNSDWPSDAIVLFNCKGLNEWDEIRRGPVQFRKCGNPATFRNIWIREL